MEKDKEDKTKEIRIQRVDANIHRQLKNIAKSKTVDIGKFMKGELPYVLDHYPDHIKNPPQSDQSE